MNKRRAFTIALTLVVMAINGATYGQYLDPTTRTNVNKVDPLFKKSVGNYKDFEKSIDNAASAGVSSASTKKVKGPCKR